MRGSGHSSDYGNYTYTERVEFSHERFNGQQVVAIREYDSGRLESVEYWNYDDTTLYLHGVTIYEPDFREFVNVDTITFTPSKALQFARHVRLGQSTAQKATMRSSLILTSMSRFTMKIVKFETVSVPYGRFTDCLQLQRKTSASYPGGIKEDEDEYDWFHPTAGSVKWTGSGQGSGGGERWSWSDAEELEQISDLRKIEPPTSTPTNTPTATHTPSSTFTPTNTPTPTQTSTSIPSPTPTSTPDTMIARDVILFDVDVPSNFQSTGNLSLTLSPLTIQEPDAKRSKLSQIAPPDVLSVIVSPSKYKPTYQFQAPSHSRKPLAVVMDFDSSGSLADTDKSRLRVDAGIAFVNTLASDDRAAVFDFGPDTTAGFQATRRVCSLTSNKERLSNAIDGLQADGGTPMYASLLDILNYMIAHVESSESERAIMLILRRTAGGRIQSRSGCRISAIRTNSHHMRRIWPRIHSG